MSTFVSSMLLIIGTGMPSCTDEVLCYLVASVIVVIWSKVAGALLHHTVEHHSPDTVNDIAFCQDQAFMSIMSPTHQIVFFSKTLYPMAADHGTDQGSST